MSATKVTLLLIGLVTVMFTPVMIGHGLAEHNPTRIVLGLVCLVIGAAILFVHIKAAGKSDPARG